MKKNSQKNIERSEEKVHVAFIKATAPLNVCVIRGLFFCPKMVDTLQEAPS